MSRDVLRAYLAALGAQDFEALGRTLAAEVRRIGPYGDVVEGRRSYVAFLERVVPRLEGYELVVHRIRVLEDGAALVELSEHLDEEGTRRAVSEALTFEFDAEGLIARVDVYIKPPSPG